MHRLEPPSNIVSTAHSQPQAPVHRTQQRLLHHLKRRQLRHRLQLLLLRKNPVIRKAYAGSISKNRQTELISKAQPSASLMGVTISFSQKTTILFLGTQDKIFQKRRTNCHGISAFISPKILGLRIVRGASNGDSDGEQENVAMAPISSRRGRNF